MGSILTAAMGNNKEYMHEYYLKNKDKIKVRISAQQKLNRNRIRERARELYYERYRTKKYAQIYKISVEEMTKLLEIKKCVLCGESKFKLHIDHDHTTGKVRGRICQHCNRGLGGFKDSIELLELAIQYLKVNL